MPVAQGIGWRGIGLAIWFGGAVPGRGPLATHEAPEGRAEAGPGAKFFGAEAVGKRFEGEAPSFHEFSLQPCGDSCYSKENSVIESQS